MLLGFDFTSTYAWLVYVGGGLLVLIGLLEKLFGWWGWLKARVLPTNEDELRRREHDKRLLNEIRKTLPRELVTAFLRDQDFGTGWRKEWMWPISELVHRNNVEDRFLDEELERRRVELHAALSTLNGLFGTDSWPEKHNQEWQDVGVSPRGPDDEETVVWERRQRLLNQAATDSADAYDALVEAARQKTLL